MLIAEGVQTYMPPASIFAMFPSLMLSKLVSRAWRSRLSRMQASEKSQSQHILEKNGCNENSWHVSLALNFKRVRFTKSKQKVEHESSFISPMTWPIGIQVTNLSGDHSFLGIGGWICLCDFWLGYSHLLRSRGHLAELVAFFFFEPLSGQKQRRMSLINVSICQSVAKIVEFNGDSTTRLSPKHTKARSVLPQN